MIVILQKLQEVTRETFPLMWKLENRDNSTEFLLHKIFLTYDMHLRMPHYVVTIRYS